MPRIKVTGYLDTEDLPPEHVDTTHEMGLSSDGYEYFATHPITLDDTQFELLGEDD